MTTVATKLARNRVTLPISALVENTDCTFQGNMPDPDNCQCKNLNGILIDNIIFCFLAYYTCKEDVITRTRCLDKQLFDEDNRLCNDYRKVFCGNRPINERGNDPCKNIYEINKMKYFCFFVFRYRSTEWLVCR